MIRITKHGIYAFQFVCSKCKCEFYTDGEEIIREKKPDGEAYIFCPECGAKCNLDNNKKEKIRK